VPWFFAVARSLEAGVHHYVTARLFSGPGDPNDPATWRDELGSTHELEAFLEEVSGWLESDHKRIRATARADPGTAGDQSESAWAQLFRNWLPPSLTVVTEGRILSPDGQYSDQMDVVILSGACPRYLAEKKIY
jgi:hypothetical protein